MMQAQVEVSLSILLGKRVDFNLELRNYIFRMNFNHTNSFFTVVYNFG